MKAKLFVEELGVELGLAGLALDENYACTIATDDNLITLQYQPQDRTFLVFAPVLSADESFSAPVLEYALEANLFGRDTLGMHLGYYSPISALVLSAAVGEDEKSVQEFMDYLSFFAAELAKWQSNIQSKIDANPTSSASSAHDEVVEEYTRPLNQRIRI